MRRIKAIIFEIPILKTDARRLIVLPVRRVAELENIYLDFAIGLFSTLKHVLLGSHKIIIKAKYLDTLVEQTLAKVRTD